VTRRERAFPRGGGRYEPAAAFVDSQPQKLASKLPKRFSLQAQPGKSASSGNEPLIARVDLRLVA
jgi:hypothetical protein